MPKNPQCRVLDRFPRSLEKPRRSSTVTRFSRSYDEADGEERDVEDEEGNEQSSLKCISDVGIKRKFPEATTVLRLKRRIMGAIETEQPTPRG